ncbi:hypothetical protein B0H17DRAFT_1025339 [Mycena rosella]|uniref:Uncharacterized protein n=1 Tax=Mycena rosella TaxID=1033263 RepID=A0AAD7BBD5_MYCRO|nr:hypothetical protein B0H17DRAFT_1025339 [Mycena rosella]
MGRCSLQRGSCCAGASRRARCISRRCRRPMSSAFRVLTRRGASSASALAPNAEAKFQKAVKVATETDNAKKYPNLYAFHGSALKNWCLISAIILTHELKNSQCRRRSTTTPTTGLFFPNRPRPLSIAPRLLSYFFHIPFGDYAKRNVAAVVDL